MLLRRLSFYLLNNLLLLRKMIKSKRRTNFNLSFYCQDTRYKIQDKRHWIQYFDCRPSERLHSPARMRNSM